MERIGRGHLLPFLVVAYPATFGLLQVRPYCGSRCGPFAAHVVALVAVAAGSLLASVLVVSPILARAIDRSGRSDDPLAASVRSPSGPTVAVLAGSYLAFVGFLFLDVANVAEAIWKPVFLPASFLPFAPVWALYAGTFVLAVVFRLAGVAWPPGLTPAVRLLVVGGGFACSAVWQLLLVEGLLGRRSRGDGGGSP